MALDIRDEKASSVLFILGMFGAAGGGAGMMVGVLGRFGWFFAASFLVFLFSLWVCIRQINIEARLQREDRNRRHTERLEAVRLADEKSHKALIARMGDAGVVFDRETVSFVLPKGRKYVSLQASSGGGWGITMRPMREGETAESYEYLDVDGLLNPLQFIRVREQA